MPTIADLSHWSGLASVSPYICDTWSSRQQQQNSRCGVEFFSVVVVRGGERRKDFGCVRSGTGSEYSRLGSGERFSGGFFGAGLGWGAQWWWQQQVNRGRADFPAQIRGGDCVIDWGRGGRRRGVQWPVLVVGLREGRVSRQDPERERKERKRVAAIVGAADKVEEAEATSGGLRAMGLETNAMSVAGGQNVGPIQGELPSEVIEEINQEALVWSSLHGLVVGDKSVKRSGTTPGKGMVHVPLALLPTPYPKQAFNQARELAVHFNTLVDRVSQDNQFLQEALARTRKADSFTARLLDIHSQILSEGIKQEIQLGLHRSDYMLDMATGELLQVEVNTISSSFASLGSLTSKLHRYLVERFGHEMGLNVENIPYNNAADSFVEGLGRAWEEYGNHNAAVLMVVHANETNMYDQHWLSFKLYQGYGIKVIRRTLAEVEAQARVDDKRNLYLAGQAIAVVYYRSGYSPDDYTAENDWEARLLLERSSAVKCPSISYHLAGAKKIQQELAKPGVLERFLQDKEAIVKIRESFAGLWSLDGEGSENILEEAVSNPEGFVLKPQREGGGNNIYGQDVATTIRKLSQEEDGGALGAYILMQRIFPALNTSYLIRDGIWRKEKIISELGIFGTFLRNGNKEILNKPAGHLVRSKLADSNEGGVAAGYGVLDSPYLT